MKWEKASKLMPEKEGRFVVKRFGEPMIVDARLFKNDIMAFVIPNGMQWKGWKDFEWLDESDESPSSDPAEVLVKAIPADVARKILLVRDALVKRDMEGAYHHLYSIASPKFDQYEPWKELEEIAKHEQLKQQ